MKLIDFLPKEHIVFGLESTDKEDLLKELVERGVLRSLSSIGLVAQDVQKILKSLSHREELCSTAIGNGVAIPHCKMEGLRNFTVVLGIHKEGIDFNASDQQRSQIFLLLLSPSKESALQFKLLARMQRLFKEKSLRKMLLEASDIDDVHDLVAREEARYFEKLR